MKSVAQPWYKTDRIRDGLFCITEPHYTWVNRANIWLVKGRDADMVIDTGLGVSSLKLYLADMLDKPLKVIASHVHFDHSGCCHEFDDVFIHKHEHQALCQGDQRLMLTTPDLEFVPGKDFELLPYEGFSANEYVVKACPQAQAIEHGEIIDLGDQAFEVLHLPGHSSGSIGLFNPKTGQFFSGDVVYDGQILDELEDSVIEEYVATMERLLNLKADEIRPGHYQSFDRRKLKELVSLYIDKRKAPICPSEG